ncbi:MAG: DUF362 domain-containing protein [bacterium]
MKAKVAVLKTSPETVIDDYARLLDLAEYQNFIPKDTDIIIKLNLSWTKFFPACSTPPWELDGLLNKLKQDGYDFDRLFPVENKTVVTNPVKGAKNNLWYPVLEKYGLKFIPLPDVEWIKYDFKSPLLKLNEIFPEGIYIPKMFVGKSVIHLPTLKTHGHSTITGAVKNSFGGLLKEVRHYAHKYMHEVLVDLMYMQKEIHPSIFAVMDGTIGGNGAGPRTMLPEVCNLILASGDSVAIDAVEAKLMGYDPISIPYINMCHERGLGVGDPKEIEIVGLDISTINLHFFTKRSFVIWGDQMLRKGFLRFLEKIALHSPLVFWAPLASNIYHDWLWYPSIGKSRIKKFMTTAWGKLFLKYMGL